MSDAFQRYLLSSEMEIFFLRTRDFWRILHAELGFFKRISFQHFQIKRRERGFGNRL